MPSTFSGDAVRLGTPASYDARAAVAPSDRGRSGAPDPVTAATTETLVAALEGSGLVLLARVDLAPAPGERATPPSDHPQKVEIEVDVAAEQDAVVLLERHGVYSWHLPVNLAQRNRALEPGPRTARFEVVLSPRATAGAPRQERRSGDLVGGRAQVLVLRFAAPVLLENAVAVMEAHIRPGLVQIADPDLSSWRHFETLDQLHLPVDRPVRLLLLVHGTFSSTAGTFGSLTVEPNGTGFLQSAIAAYDAVIGFDHKTLSLDPRQSAEDLVKRLRTHHPDREVVVDVITHGRGGAVTRAFVEEALPGSGWPGTVDVAVLVAAADAGTHLADPERRVDLVDLYTNLASVRARSLALVPGTASLATVATGTVTGIGEFVKYLASYAGEGDDVPGLRAMVPVGASVEDPDRTPPGPGANWHAVTSSFRVARSEDHHAPPEFPRELVAQLEEGLVDRLLEGENDLVVGTSSMSAIGRVGGSFVRDTLALGENDVVYHTNYFDQLRVLEAMAGWLPLGLGAGGGPATAALELVERQPALAGPFPEAMEAFPEAPGDAAMPGSDMREEVQGALLAARSPRREAPPVPAQRVATHETSACIAAEMPAHVVAGTEFAVRVRLTRSPAAAMDGPARAGADVSDDPDRPLSVQVYGKSNAEALTPDTDALELSDGDGVSEVRLRALTLAAGPAVVMIVVRQGRVPVATLSLGTNAVSREHVDTVPLGTSATAGVRLGVDAPEIEGVPCIDIVERELPNGSVIYQYAVRLLPDQPAATFESKPVTDRVRRVARILDVVAQIWKQPDQEPRERERQLQDIGAEMFDELFPEEMREHLWRHRERVKDLIVYTDEPFVPWELVHLDPPKGPRPAKSRFLAQTGLVRWHLDSFPPREMQVRHDHARSLCPDYLDPRFTPVEPLREQEFLEERLGTKLVTATPAGVRSLLRSGSFDLLHFSGQGAVDPDDTLDAKLLLRGRRRGSTVDPEYLAATTVSTNAAWRRRDEKGPLVVLNACQVGRPGELVTTVGGFARAFLDAGASAFVACLWSVHQEPSPLFVERLYEELLAGTPMGRASARAREATRRAGDATWLSFVVYARPDAVLVRS